MQAYRFETHVQQNGTLTVDNLPLRPGEAVEVIILVRSLPPEASHYPLRGLPVIYEHPTEPIAEQDWAAA